VHFYEDDSIFLDNLGEFTRAELTAGNTCAIIATRAHREGLTECLGRAGIDVRSALNENRLIYLGSEETLAQLMIEDWPDKERFFSLIEPGLQRAKAAAQQRSRSVVLIGELAPLLCAEGKTGAAVQLEQFATELVQRNLIPLRCVYSLAHFATDSEQELFRQVCAEHDHVFPAESYASLESEEDRMRMVSALQHKAALMQAVMGERQRELAQRRHLESSLRRSEQLARQVMESSLDCFKVLSLDGRIEYISPPGLKALGIEDVSQILGARWVDFWNEEERPRLNAAIAAAKAGGIGTFQGDFLTPSGIRKSWDVRVTAVRGEGGEIEKLIAVSRDVTELKDARQVVLQTEKLAATGRMAATIAHEINNPLEAVTNLIYIAKTNQDAPKEVSRLLEIADRELERVAQIAQQTLGFYRDNSSNSWIGVAGLIDDVLVIYDRKLKLKRIGTIVQIEKDLRVYGKQGELKQALSNLLANAIEASSVGSKIRLRARGIRDWTNSLEPGVRITLADTGTGMTPEVRRRVFTPFFTTKPGIGTGIGLWVTKSLIEQQGGYLRFRSRQGQNTGTVMSFFVPDASSRTNTSSQG
jgi:PAS domain S-box-containing protein